MNIPIFKITWIMCEIISTFVAIRWIRSMDKLTEKFDLIDNQEELLFIIKDDEDMNIKEKIKTVIPTSMKVDVLQKAQGAINEMKENNRDLTDAIKNVFRVIANKRSERKVNNAKLEIAKLTNIANAHAILCGLPKVNISHEDIYTIEEHKYRF